MLFDSYGSTLEFFPFIGSIYFQYQEVMLHSYILADKFDRQKHPFTQVHKYQPFHWKQNQYILNFPVHWFTLNQSLMCMLSLKKIVIIYAKRGDKSAATHCCHPFWCKSALSVYYSIYMNTLMQLGAQWLSGRVLDSRPKDSGFEPHRRHCVVVLEQDTFILA